VPRLLDRYNTIPADSQGILWVEGTSDSAFIEIAAEKLGRKGTIKKVHVIPNTGTDSLVLQAVLLRAETDRPIWALLDSDENGRHARDLLAKRFKMNPKDVLEYGRLLGDAYCQDAEAEWLFPAKTMENFVKKYGESVLKSKSRKFGDFRYDFTPEGKDAFPQWLRKNAKQSDLGGWRTVFDAIDERLAASSS
jgi:phage pi2 protein 07